MRLIKILFPSSELIETYTRCKERNLKTYEKPVFHPTSYQKLTDKIHLNPAQEECVKLLYTWRDGYARLHDESTGWILPNYQLINISKELPRENSGVLACCTPIPSAVRENLRDITELVQTARLKESESQNLANTTVTGATVSRDTSVFAKVNVSQGASGVFNYSDVVDCPHDIRKDKKVQPFKLNSSKEVLTASKPSISTFAPVKKLNQTLLNVTSFLQSVLKNSENMSSKEFLIDEFEWKIKETKGEVEMKRLGGRLKNKSIKNYKILLNF